MSNTPISTEVKIDNRVAKSNGAFSKSHYVKKTTLTLYITDQ